MYVVHLGARQLQVLLLDSLSRGMEQICLSCFLYQPSQSAICPVGMGVHLSHTSSASPSRQTLVPASSGGAVPAPALVPMGSSGMAASFRSCTAAQYDMLEVPA